MRYEWWLTKQILLWDVTGDLLNKYLYECEWWLTKQITLWDVNGDLLNKYFYEMWMVTY